MSFFQCPHPVLVHFGEAQECWGFTHILSAHSFLKHMLNLQTLNKSLYSYQVLKGLKEQTNKVQWKMVHCSMSFYQRFKQL